MKSVARASIIASIAFLGIAGALHADPATQPAASQPTTAPIVISWEQAAKHVGETATVTGPVKGTHITSNGKSLILNVGKDYPDPGRFSIMIAIDAKHPADESAYTGKTVTATGKIELYRKVPEVKVNGGEVTIAPAQ
jgi:DNA/RNA endonuclease YhcR with UshA esterase domain